MNTATEDQIKLWKEQHGDVYQIKVEDSVCYLKKPDRKTLGYASQAGKTDPMKFNEVIIKGCWLGGDEEIMTNDSLFLGACTQLAVVVAFKEAELVKL
jgi:hypothetical protein